MNTDMSEVLLGAGKADKGTSVDKLSVRKAEQDGVAGWKWSLQMRLEVSEASGMGLKQNGFMWL